MTIYLFVLFLDRYILFWVTGRVLEAIPAGGYPLQGPMQAFGGLYMAQGYLGTCPYYQNTFQLEPRPLCFLFSPKLKSQQLKRALADPLSAFQIQVVGFSLQLGTISSCHAPRARSVFLNATLCLKSRDK